LEHRGWQRAGIYTRMLSKYFEVLEFSVCESLLLRYYYHADFLLSNQQFGSEVIIVLSYSYWVSCILVSQCKSVCMCHVFLKFVNSLCTTERFELC